MIIDLILDRKDGKPYNSRDFYHECMEYSEIFEGIGDWITKAMDYGTEEDVQVALIKYILDNGYNPELFGYVGSVKWLEDDKLNPMCMDCRQRGHGCHGTTEMVWTGCASKIK